MEIPFAGKDAPTGKSASPKKILPFAISCLGPRGRTGRESPGIPIEAAEVTLVFPATRNNYHYYRRFQEIGSMPAQLCKRLGFACLCLLPLEVRSQSPEDSLWTAPASRIPGSFNLYFFPALPMGDFGDDGDNGGFATVGAGAGLEYFIPFGSRPLGWMASAAIAINPVDHEAAADALADQMPSGNVEVNGGRWLTIPLQTGLRVGVRPVPNLALQAQVLGGVTIVNQAEYTFTSTGYEAKLIPETAFTPGLMLGGGLLCFDRIQIGVRLFRTVKTRMKAKFSDSEGEKADQEGRIATTLLAFSLGVQF